MSKENENYKNYGIDEKILSTIVGLILNYKKAEKKD